MGSVTRAFKKVVKKVLGLGSTPSQAVQVQQTAPAVEQPLQEVEGVEMGSDESNLKRKKRGKSSLKIDRGTSNVASSSSGVNIV